MREPSRWAPGNEPPGPLRQQSQGERGHPGLRWDTGVRSSQGGSAVTGQEGARPRVLAEEGTQVRLRLGRAVGRTWSLGSEGGPIPLDALLPGRHYYFSGFC